MIDIAAILKDHEKTTLEVKKAAGGFLTVFGIPTPLLPIHLVAQFFLALKKI